ncbi:hypothetical protein IB49_09120 [Geobacillus sp. LC300]|nr:hypothetical protein IB49_09120 [Geobacillus sp. LC300]
MNKNSLVKTFVNFSIGPLGAAVINFLTIPITTWMVTPEEFGKTTLFMVMQTLATAFIFLGMDHSYVREYNNIENKKELLFNSLIFPFLSSLCISILLLIFSKNITELIIGSGSEIVVILFSIWLPFVTLERFLLLSIRMEENGVAYSFFNILIKFLIMVFTLLFLLLFSRNYVTVIAATVLGQIMSDIFLIFYCRNKLNFNIGSFNKKLFKDLLHFGLPFIPTSVLLWSLNSTDRLIIGMFSSGSELGIYSAALKVVGILTIFQSIFSSFWLPVAYKWEKQKVDTSEFNIVSRYLAFTMSLIFLLILIGKEFIVYILSDKYYDVIYVIPFLLFYPIMYTIGEATGLGISFSRKTHYNIWISIVVTIVNLVLNFLLVPHLGAIGASIATGGTYIVYFWIKTIISRKLWYDFDLKYYIILISILLIASIANIVVHGFSVILINVILFFILCIYNRTILINVYLKIKSWKQIKKYGV